MKKNNALSIEIYHHNPDPFGFDIRGFIKWVLDQKKITAGHFEFTFVSPETMRSLHQTYLNNPEDTDILTFNLSHDQRDLIVDIYICDEEALANSRLQGHPFDTEIKTLILHGILHVLGYTDADDGNRAIMFAEQDRLLSASPYD